MLVENSGILDTGYRVLCNILYNYSQTFAVRSILAAAHDMKTDYDMDAPPEDTEMALQTAENEILIGGQASRFVHHLDCKFM